MRLRCRGSRCMSGGIFRMLHVPPIHVSSTRIDTDWWVEQPQETRDAWCEFMEAHGFDANRVGFPLVIEWWKSKPLMRVRYFDLDDQGKKFMWPSGEVAQTTLLCGIRDDVPCPALPNLLPEPR